MRRPRAPYDRLYKTSSWQAARAAHLARYPLCDLCQQRGLLAAANVVNHRIPHKGDLALFRDPLNLQSVCRACHDGAIRSYELTGRMRGCDVDGMPLDPEAPWNGGRQR